MLRWPTVIYSEEVMREGFGIESVDIPLEARVELLERLSRTGLKRITVGAFVSARYVPQMAAFETLLKRFTPTPGVAYLTFSHTPRAIATARQFSPPLTVEDELCTLFLDLCDIHQRRNMNRSIEQVMDTWPELIADAKGRGITEARVGLASFWGSNFSGTVTAGQRFGMLQRCMDVLGEQGMTVVEIGLHDSQSWCLPHLMEQDLAEIKRRWPGVRHFHLHMHDARGMALPSLYAALRTLDSDDTVLVEGTLGGIGGGQYCGNGTASGMVATEDFIHMLEGMGIETGVDLDRLIDCVWLLERILGRPAFGHVSRAGPRPVRPDQWYDANLPAIESLRAARHFREGSAAYRDEAYSPWKQPIAGPYFTLPESTSDRTTP